VSKHLDDNTMDHETEDGNVHTDQGDRPGRRRALQWGASGTLFTVIYGGPQFARAQASMNTSAMCSAVGQDTNCALGLSAGFWKHNTDVWSAEYQTTALFDAVFGVAAFGDKKLEDVINGAEPAQVILSQCSTGNPDNDKKSEKAITNMGRQAVAGLQNAATLVPYFYTLNDVHSMCSSALNSCDPGQIERVKDDLERANTSGDSQDQKRLRDMLYRMG